MKTMVVTGAAGFLGSHIIESALAQGYAVKALIRPRRDINHLEWANNPMVEMVEIDLSLESSIKNMASLLTKLEPNNTIFIHAAAAFIGTDQEHFLHTIKATKNVFNALVETSIRRVVLISSLSVYGFSSLPDYTQLDETSPTEAYLTLRDAYCRAKSAQEKIAIIEAQNNGFIISVLRPGAIYDQKHPCSARLGVVVGPFIIKIDGKVNLPLIAVTECAQIVVLAAERDNVKSDIYINKKDDKHAGSLEFINVIGDEQSTQNDYLTLLNKSGVRQPKTLITIPWRVMRSASKMVSFISVFFPALATKLPLLMFAPSLHARFKPLRYSNCRLKDRLTWDGKSNLDSNLMKNKGGGRL